jgi:hypothetical protein
MTSKFKVWFFIPESLEYPRFTDKPPITGRVLEEYETIVPVSVLNSWDEEGRCVQGLHLIRPKRY